MPVTTLTINLDETLADRLKAAAEDYKATIESLVEGCIEQHLEIALRHRVLVERMDIVDGQIDAIARFVEEASSGGGLDPVDLFRICRYRREA